MLKLDDTKENDNNFSRRDSKTYVKLLMDILKDPVMVRLLLVWFTSIRWSNGTHALINDGLLPVLHWPEGTDEYSWVPKILQAFFDLPRFFVQVET